MEQGLRTHVWESMLVADMNYRYYLSLTAWHRGIDRAAKVLIALTSSATVSGWAIWGRPGLDWIWKLTSAAAAITAVALPVFDPAKSMRTASELAGSWFAVMRDYEMLWAEVDDAAEDKVRDKCSILATEEKRLSQLESSLSVNKRIADRSETAMRKARASHVWADGGANA